MPGGDRTGPMGNGSMTGRGMGFCTGFAAPGYMKAGGNWGRGYARIGWGGRGGWGFRRNVTLPGVYPDYPVYGSYIPAGNEKEYYSRQVDALENQLQWLKKRLNDVDEGGKATE